MSGDPVLELPTVEALLDRLEAAIARLADGSAPLEQLVADHQAAARLVEAAETRLAAAAARARTGP